jgi:hypothetical protein
VSTESESSRDFDDLIEIVDQELAIQFQVRRFGLDVEPPDDAAIRKAAVLIADEVISSFRLERRVAYAPNGVAADEAAE